MTIKDATINASRRVGRPPRGSEGEATLRIIAAATPIFLTEGFEAASIDAIAVAAGISKKTFYVRFTSKADLFEAVCVSFIEQRVPLIEGMASMEGPTSECLHELAMAILISALTPELVAFKRIVTAEAVRFPEFARTLHDFGFSRVLPLIERCLERGVRSGEIVVDDVQFAADYFLSLTVRAPFERSLLGLERPEVTHVKRKNLRRAVEFFLRACRP